jgi:hypothetical protein
MLRNERATMNFFAARRCAGAVPVLSNMKIAKNMTA